jgi:hypothetical protein
MILTAMEILRRRRVGFNFQLAGRHAGMRILQFVLDPIALEKPQAATAVSLTGENIKVAVAIPVDGVGAGDHLRRRCVKNGHRFRAPPPTLNRTLFSKLQPIRSLA